MRYLNVLLAVVLIGRPITATAQAAAQDTAQGNEAALHAALVTFRNIIKPNGSTDYLLLPNRGRAEIELATRTLGVSHVTDTLLVACVVSAECANIPDGARVITFMPLVRSGDSATFVGRVHRRTNPSSDRARALSGATQYTIRLVLFSTGEWRVVEATGAVS